MHNGPTYNVVREPYDIKCVEFQRNVAPNTLRCEIQCKNTSS